MSKVLNKYSVLLILVLVVVLGLLRCEKSTTPLEIVNDEVKVLTKGDPDNSVVILEENVDRSGRKGLEAEACIYYWTTSSNLNKGQSINYTWNVNNNEYHHISMTPPIGCDFDISLYNPDGTKKASSIYSSDRTDVITYTIDKSGTWKLKVYAYSGNGTYALSWVRMNTDDYYIYADVEIDNTTRNIYGDYLKKTYDQFRDISNIFKNNSLKTIFLIHDFKKVTNAEWGNGPTNDFKLVINEGGNIGCFADNIWTIGHNFNNGVYSLNGRRALQHEFAHYRATQDLYGAGDVTEIMGTTYDTDNFEAGTRDVINYSARKNRQDYGETISVGTSMAEHPITDDDGRMYWVINDVDTNKDLTVKLENLNADLDIVIRSKYHPTKSLYDGRSQRGGSNSETITITPTWGRVYVLIYGYNGATSSYKLSSNQ